MTTAQVDFTPEELLSTHEYAEPLIAGGVRCHGGFTHAGTYVSPRTKHRVPAIEAWQAKHRTETGADLLGLPIDTWPASYPNVAQAKLLLENGVRQPTISTLTRIGTVEGFGGMIRYSVVPDLEATFVEDTRGTATAHLERGLYEAHARDEAGYEEGDVPEGGHKQMWFAARDVAFENPATEDETMKMLERMGIPMPAKGGSIDLAALRAQAMANRLLPAEVPYDLEALLERMIRLLFIEISAFHVFAWAEELLADDALVAGNGEAARLVSYIRADETPHVEYLRTVLSEMRARTVIGEGGTKLAGADVVDPIWDRALAESLGPRRTDGLNLEVKEVTRALAGRTDAADLLEQFHTLGDIRPGPDGTWSTNPS
jgi:hypothetical protein